MRRLERAARAAVSAWGHGRGFGAPPMGSAVYDVLRELDTALRASDWIRCRVALPEPSSDPDNDYGAWVNSKRVLAWADGKAWTAYVQHWPKDEGGPRWIQSGRDGYDLEGVTHWQPLPDGPSTGLEHGTRT